MNRQLLLPFFLFLASITSSQSQELIDKQQLIGDLNYLASDDLGGRGNNSDGNKKARNFIEDRFQDLGLKPMNDSYRQSFTFKKREDKEFAGVNVVGILPGKSDKKLIITAHYDHLGTRDGKIFNGADDNASGVAGILAIARYYSVNSPENTLVFVAFDAEEMSLQGARYFVQNLAFDKEKVIANINLDMVGRDDNNRIVAAGGSHYPQLKDLITEIQEKAPVDLIQGNDQESDGQNNWTFASDHGPFHEVGIPFVYFGVEDHKDYHKDTDTADKINPAFFQSTVQTILMTVEALDKRNQ